MSTGQVRAADHGAVSDSAVVAKVAEKVMPASMAVHSGLLALAQGMAVVCAFLLFIVALLAILTYLDPGTRAAPTWTPPGRDRSSPATKDQADARPTATRHDTARATVPGRRSS